MKQKIFYLVKVSILILMYAAICVNISIFCFVKAPQFNKPKSLTYIDNNGQTISETLWSKSGTYIELDEVSSQFINVLLACEDKRFYKHSGIDLLRIAKALFANISAGEISQGGSTITQQFVKNTFLSNEKTYRRKIREIVTALKVESAYSKEKILTGYINSLYFGHGVYGIENAAQYYFGKKALELTVAESTMLVGIINAPSIYSPTDDIKVAKQKQVQVLDYLLQSAQINRYTYQQALNQELVFTFQSPLQSSTKSYYLDCVNKELENLDLLSTDNVNNGLIVETYYDSYINTLIENSIASLRITDANTNLAIQVMLPYSNKVVASVGGKNYDESVYNRVISSKRQIGSTIKPLIYYLGLLNGLTPITKMRSEKTTFYIRGFGEYAPSNFNDKYPNSDINMIEAVAVSDNIYATKTGLLIGSKNLQKFFSEFSVEVDARPSLFLGTCELSLEELTGIYNTFASEGDYYKPSYVKKVTNSFGRILYENKKRPLNLLSYDTTLILNQLLRAPFDKNIVGYSRPSLQNYQTDQVFAAKTGTVNNTSWVMAYNPNYTIGLWVGSEDGSDFNQGILSKYLFRSVANSLTKGMDQRWYSPSNRLYVKQINPMTGLEDKKGSIYYLAK